LGGDGADGAAAVVMLNAGAGEATLELAADELAGRELAACALPGEAGLSVEAVDRAAGRYRLTLAGRSGGVAVAG
jgi:hypothetical protein